MSDFKTLMEVDKDRLHLSVPITKIDVQNRRVSGFATLDNIDLQDDIVPLDASIAAFESFRGNIREMHQPVAVGSMVSFQPDEYFDAESGQTYKGIYVSVYVSKGAQDTWEKVLDKTLTGFSIGGDIGKYEDIFVGNLETPVRLIKEFRLSELSLVDSPANQFANILSIEKGIATGFVSKAIIESVYWCAKEDIVRISTDANATCPQCDAAMQNIGFVESDDKEKRNVIKGLLASTKKALDPIFEGTFVKHNGAYSKVERLVHEGSVKLSSSDDTLIATESDPVAIMKTFSETYGIIVPTGHRIIMNTSSLEKVNAIIKSNVKEEQSMGTETTIVVDEQDMSLIKADGAIDNQVEPEPQTGFAVEEKTAADAPKSPDSPDEPATTAAEDAAEDAADEKNKEEAKKSAGGNGYNDDLTKATHKAVTEMAEQMSTTFKSLEETIKALNARMDGVEKSVSGEVAAVKATNDEFGKRVDAVEGATAFRKSADIGDIVQQEPLQKADQPLWGGRFLNSSDLIN